MYIYREVLNYFFLLKCLELVQVNYYNIRMYINDQYKDDIRALVII